MKKGKKLLAFAISLLTMVTTIFSNTMSVHAEDTTGLKFTKIEVTDTAGNVKADLLAGGKPSLEAGKDYYLNVAYSVPAGLQFAHTYMDLTLGNGLYYMSLPGSTWKTGPISSTGFEELTLSPTGNADSPYGYPASTADPSATPPTVGKSKTGKISFKSKYSLTNVASTKEIQFRLDDAYENMDANQILANVIKLNLRTDSSSSVDAKSYPVNAKDAPTLGFWPNVSSEVVTKGGQTSQLSVGTTGAGTGFLTKAGSSTTIDVVYPSDIQFDGLREDSIYHMDGVIGATTDDGTYKTTRVTFPENGRLMGDLSLKPRFTVPSTTTRPNGSTFPVKLKNLSQTVWNENIGRTSTTKEQDLSITILDGSTPELLTKVNVRDTMPNWAKKKYDTYNVRFGGLMIRNEMGTASRPKTLEMNLDEANTAIIRGVTIPYAAGMHYGMLTWTSADGRSGTIDPNSLQHDGVSTLIKNTDLGLGINDSIKTIKVDLGTIPGNWNGIRYEDNTNYDYNPETKAYNVKPGGRNSAFIDESAYYGWSYMPGGVFGSWKKGTDADVKSTIKFYNTGTTPQAVNTYEVLGKSGPPKVVNGIGTIDKSQINGGDKFHISGKTSDANWDWNPLQEPVFYVTMPEGFSYSNLKVTNGKLSKPVYVGEFTHGTEKVKVWKYTLDIGQETRGQYQPDFTWKTSEISMDVTTNTDAKVGTYHINDFLGMTTKDFKDIGAKLKGMRWDSANSTTEKYTADFGNAVNGGETMSSLSERRGIKVNQAYEVRADSKLIVPDGDQGSKTYIYDPSSESTKKATTPVLDRGGKVTQRIVVRNNTTKTVKHTTLYVPLFSENKDNGLGYHPEGKTQWPLKLTGTDMTSNFTVKYIKLHPGKTYSMNQAPQPGDYDVVTDPAQADMAVFESTKALAIGDGGTIDLNYEVSPTLSPTYNGKINVISPVLDYDIDGNTSTLTRQSAAVSFKTTAVDIPVEKVWKDLGSAAVDHSADSVQVRLYRNGQATNEVLTLDAAKNWKGSFGNIASEDPATHQAYNYTVKEEGLDANDQIQIGGRQYRSAVSGDANTGFKVTNTGSEKISIDVTKAWVGKAADSATVKLLADGAVKDTAVLTAGTNWKHTFENLPKYDINDGHEIAYKLDEAKVEGYKTEITGNAKDGFKVTNTITGQVSVSVTKTWVGKAADSAKIHLYADGTEKEAVTLNAGNQWKHTFANLDKYKNGVEIKYTIKEDPIANYKSEISGDMTSGYTVKNTNTEKISIPVTKTWVGKAADSATVKLLADGTVKDTAVLTKDTGWKHTFADLPKYDANNGHEIAYKLDEVKVDGYVTGISGTAENGFTVTNTITGKVSVPVTKIWVGKGADSAKIHLYADGVEKESVTLNAGNQWQHTFANLDKYKNGVEIKYTIKEDPIANYKSEISGDMTSGYTVKNTNTEKISIPVTKTWVGKAADSATVKLLADGTVKDTAVLTKDMGWKHTFADLPKYDANDGHEIAYTLDEVKVDGYVTGISGTAETGFTVTNTITGKVSVPVTKKWIGDPAEFVTVNLYADGQKVDSQKLSGDNQWQYTFADLDQYKDGQEIKYTIEEEAIAGYTTSISGDAANGFVITNTQDQPKPSPKPNVVPKNPKAPKTGDLGNLPLYGSLLLLAAVAASLLAGKRRRQTR